MASTSGPRQWTRFGARRFLALLVAGTAALAMTVVPSSPAAATSTVPPTTVTPTTVTPTTVTRGETWLTIVNGYRAQAGLPPVVERSSGNNAARKHSCYMLRNGITHDQIPGMPGYSPDGDAAGNASNVAVSSTPRQTDRRMIDLWMTGPFHAIGILRPNLLSASYGRCESTSGSFRTATTLNVLDGIDSTRLRPQVPIMWPGNGATTHLSTFVTEYPNPVEMCGWSGIAGLPVIAMFPNTASNPWSSMRGPDGRSVEVCTLWHGNVDNLDARSILGGENAVIVVPKKPLARGRYSVQVASGTQWASWSFTVRP